MLVEDLEAASVTFVPPLLLNPLRPLDVNNFIKQQFCLVGVLGSINHSGSIAASRKINIMNVGKRLWDLKTFT